MSAKNHAAMFVVVFVFDEKGVLHVTRGVIGGNIETFEIVIFRFYFRAIHNGKSELGKDAFNFFLYLGKGVDMADIWSGAGDRGVEKFVLECFF